MRSRKRDVVVIGLTVAAVALLIFGIGQLSDSESPRELLPGLARIEEERETRPPNPAGPSIPETESEKAAPTPAPDRGAEPEEQQEDEQEPAIGEADSVPRAGQIHGFVVDERTEERIPGLELRVRGNLNEPRIYSDELGSFAFDAEEPSEAVLIDLYDNGIASSEVALEPFYGPHTIVAAIGPTYPIVLETDAEVVASEWEARLVESRFPPGQRNVLEVSEEGLRVKVISRLPGLLHSYYDVASISSQEHPAPGSDISERCWPWIRFRSGDEGLWVRYATWSYPPNSYFNLRLEVRNRTQGLSGSALVEGTVGVQPRVRIDLKQAPARTRASLSGTIFRTMNGVASGSRSFSYAGNPRVVLLPTASELTNADTPPIFDERGVQEDGSFSFDNLPTGKRTVLIYSGGYDLEQRVVDLLVGENRLPTVELFHTRSRVSNGPGNIPQLITFDEPRVRPNRGQRYYSSLRLSAAGPYARSWWLGEGGSGGPERIIMGLDSTLPGAEFDHLGVATSLLPIWTPNRFRLHSADPARKIDIVPDSQRAAHGFRFSVDERDQAPQKYLVHFGPGGTFTDHVYATNDTRWTLPEDTPLRYVVWASSFAPVCGDESDFQVLGDERIANVKLESGWGAVLYFRAGNPNTLDSDRGRRRATSSREAAPLPGVGVRAYGDLLGRSDSEGRLRIALPVMPESLELDAPGWKLSGSHRMTYNRGFKKMLKHNHVIWMERE